MWKARSALIALVASLVAVAPALAEPEPTDAVIVRQVRIKLADDPLVKGGALEVTCLDGVVTLKGAVSSQKAIARAERDAESVRGVREVVNTLAVLAVQHP
jgi:osmotically-inducible protein OsmY